MYTLLDTEFWDEDIERSVENTDNNGRADDRTVTLGKICNKDAEIQMRRLLLSELRGLFLSVEKFRNTLRVIW